MKVVQTPIGSIKPYWRNPRDNTSAVEAVKASIEQFGFNQPIVCDREGVIVAGHTRYKASLELGLAKVPVVVVDLDPERAKAYRIADNKTAEMAEWDDAKLIPELREIADLVDMTPFFSDAELAQLLEDASGVGAGPSQDDIDAATGAANTQFDKVNASANADQVEVICPHCGEKSYIPRDHLTREMDATVRT